MVVKVYVSTVSSNKEMKKQQQKISMVLSGKKIAFEELDISSSEEHKQAMRENGAAPERLPPQIFNDDKYCGDFNGFDNAVEEERLEEFLKL